MTAPATQDMSASEIESLQARLEDAENTLLAIRLGEADALLVQGPGGPSVYTLVTADQSYRTLVEQMRQSAIILSLQGTVLYCNYRLSTFLGEDRFSTAGRVFSDLTVPEHRARFADLLIAAENGEAEGEFLLRGTRGDEVPVHLSVSLLHSGDFRGLAVVATDLTDRRRRERTAERERLTAAVLEFTGTAILVCDGEGRIIQGNRAALDLCGTGSIGQPIGDALPLDVSYDELRGAGAERRPVRLRSGTGEEQFLLVGARRIGNGAPEDGWWVITLTDLTERERLVQAERRVRDRLHALHRVTASLSAAASPDQIARVIVGAGRDCLGADAGLVAMLTPDGTRLEVLAAVGYPESLIEAVRRFPVHSIGEFSLDRVGQPGQTGVVPGRSNLALPLIVNHQQIGLLAFSCFGDRAWSDEELELTDALSHQCAQALDRAKLYIEERTARDAAERANLSKSEFLSVMSHELRTPLNAVMGYSDLLLLNTKGPLTPGQVEQVQRITASARHQLALIEEILSFARLDAGRERLRLAPVDVTDVIREVVEFLRPEAEGKGLTMALDLPAGEAFHIVTDPGKLRQVMLNLTANATKFTNMGTITVSASRMADGGVVIRVRDTGLGIESDRIDDIWEPFTQVDASPTRRAGGSGLGLSIVSRLVDRMGGSVEVESEFGTGSTFVVRLPASP